MVACHLNFHFQVLAFFKGTKELGVTHFTMDVPSYKLGVAKLQHLELLQACKTQKDGTCEKVLATRKQVKVSQCPQRMWNGLADNTGRDGKLHQEG